MKKNYDFKNDVIGHALENRYRERNNKEFICKPCHNKLKEGKLQPTASDNQMSVVNNHILLFQIYPVHQTGTYKIQRLQTKCLCVCCRKDDIIRYQCGFSRNHDMIFKITVKQALKE